MGKLSWISFRESSTEEIHNLTDVELEEIFRRPVTGSAYHSRYFFLRRSTKMSKTLRVFCSPLVDTPHFPPFRGCISFDLPPLSDVAWSLIHYRINSCTSLLRIWTARWFHRVHKFFISLHLYTRTRCGIMVSQRNSRLHYRIYLRIEFDTPVKPPGYRPYLASFS